MKVLTIGKHEEVGGAAKAAKNWHQMLLSNNINAEYLVEIPRSHSYNLIYPKSRFQKLYNLIKANIADLYLSKRYPNRKPFPWSINIFPTYIYKVIKNSDADIIHLHWVSRETISWNEIFKITKPIVWTMHDMWALTGGCHYSYGCNKYLSHCGNCPQLNSSSNDDISYKIFKKKLINLKNKNITIVTCSNWLGDCFKNSPLFKDFKIEVIPNPINTEIYKPVNKLFSKSLLNLDPNKKAILFMAFAATSDIRKGFQFVPEVIKILEENYNQNELEIFVIGENENKSGICTNFQITFLGHLYDELSIITALNAADVLIAPSTEENLSNVVMESLSCGTPVVAFNIGGMPDMINHLKNGYLATPFDSNELASGVKYFLETPVDRISLNQDIENRFSKSVIFNKINNLYNQIISQKQQ